MYLFIGYSSKLAGFEFPDQGLNPIPGSEIADS